MANPAHIFVLGGATVYCARLHGICRKTLVIIAYSIALICALPLFAHAKNSFVGSGDSIFIPRLDGVIEKWSLSGPPDSSQNNENMSVDETVEKTLFLANTFHVKRPDNRGEISSEDRNINHSNFYNSVMLGSERGTPIAAIHYSTESKKLIIVVKKGPIYILDPIAMTVSNSIDVNYRYNEQYIPSNSLFKGDTPSKLNTSSAYFEENSLFIMSDRGAILHVIPIVLLVDETISAITFGEKDSVIHYKNSISKLLVNSIISINLLKNGIDDFDLKLNLGIRASKIAVCENVVAVGTIGGGVIFLSEYIGGAQKVVFARGRSLDIVVKQVDDLFAAVRSQSINAIMCLDKNRVAIHAGAEIKIYDTKYDYPIKTISKNMLKITGSNFRMFNMYFDNSLTVTDDTNIIFFDIDSDVIVSKKLNLYKETRLERDRALSMPCDKSTHRVHVRSTIVGNVDETNLVRTDLHVISWPRPQSEKPFAIGRSSLEYCR